MTKKNQPVVSQNVVSYKQVPIAAYTAPYYSFDETETNWQHILVLYRLML